jgi:hypothetical protein
MGKLDEFAPIAALGPVLDRRSMLLVVGVVESSGGRAGQHQGDTGVRQVQRAELGHRVDEAVERQLLAHDPSTAGA